MTATGLVWSWSALGASAVMQLMYTAVMSRLLEPDVFGQLAAALLALRFVFYLAQFGLGSALVQREALSREAVATAQTISLGIGFATASLAVALSPVLAALVRMPAASGAIRWLSVGMLVTVLTVVPDALLRRAMRFRALAVCQTLSFAIGYLGIGVPLAVRGWGVGSLVAASLGQAVVLLALSLAMARPPTRLRFDRREAQSLVTFGGLVGATGFLEFLSGSVDTIAVSRWVGAAGLGQYTRATYLVGLPIEQAISATSRVLLPSFSKVQNDPQRFRRGYLMSCGILSCLVMVPMALLAVGAPALVPIVLGPGWNSAASVMPLVGCAYGLSLLTHLPAFAAESRGAVRRKLELQAVTLVLTVGLVGTVAATEPTLHRLAGAWLAGETVRHLLYWRYVHPVLGVSQGSVAKRYRVALLLAVGTAAPMWMVVRVLGHVGVESLLVGGIAAALMGGAILASPGSRTLRQDVAELRSNLSAQPAARSSDGRFGSVEHR